MIKKCEGANCKHGYQDKKYGEGMRVHNPKADGRWKCTICENIRS